MGVLQQATGSMGGGTASGRELSEGGCLNGAAAASAGATAMVEIQSGGMSPSGGGPFRRGPMVEVLPAGKLTPQGLEYARQRGIYRGDDLSW